MRTRVAAISTAVVSGILQYSPAAPSVATQLQENIATQDQPVVSPTGDWKASVVISSETSNYKLVLENRAGLRREVDESGKPDFRIVWSRSEKYVAVSKPTGFTTMISIFGLSPDNITALFSSAKTNQWPYVDYALDEWDTMSDRAVLKLYENPRYLEAKRRSRLLAVIYVYLDGKTDYGVH